MCDSVMIVLKMCKIGCKKLQTGRENDSTLHVQVRCDTDSRATYINKKQS